MPADGRRRRQLAIAAVLAALAGAGPAGGQSCGDIVSGSVTLGADLSCPSGYGLVVASGATLDCAGHAITGADQVGQYGVYLRDAAGAVVENCTVTHFEVGIRLKGAAGCTVEDSVVQSNTRYGMEITQGSTHALVQRNRVLASGDEGIHVSGPTGADAGNQMLGNTVDGNVNEGIYLLTSDANTIADNTIQNQGTAGIYVKGSSRNTITGNVLTNDRLELIAGAQLNVLAANTIVGEHVKLDGASGNQFTATSVRANGGRPSVAYELIGAADNTFADSGAIDPVDATISAVGASPRNAFTRFMATPALRCAIGPGSSVAVTDVDGNRVGCGSSPVDERLLGRKLLLRDNPASPGRRRLLVISKDQGITRGGGPATADDPTAAGARLRLRTAANGGFDVTYPLPAGNWSYAATGYRYIDRAASQGPVTGVAIVEQSLLLVRGKGAGLGHALGASPVPVDVVLTFGATGTKYCMRFSAGAVLKGGQLLLARTAAAPATCPP